MQCDKLLPRLGLTLSLALAQLISRVSNEQKWDVKLSDCLRIWKAGCIIRSGGITSFLEPIIKQHENLPNPLVVSEIAQELSRNYANLKSICAIAIEADAVAPTLQATLEYIKGFGNKQLPTNFTAMQFVHRFSSPVSSEVGRRRGHNCSDRVLKALREWCYGGRTCFLVASFN